MARPKVSKADKRSVKFSFRLTEAEQQKLFQLAETLGLAPGRIVRDKVFKGRFPEPKMAKIDVNTYAQLKKIGVNLNQVVKLIHLGHFPKEFLGLLMKLLQQEETIINRLFYDRESEDR